MSLIELISAGAALLILGGTALAVLRLVVETEQDLADIDAEVAARTTEGPVRVHPADDLTAIASAVTDHAGRAL